jgi:hypothetical protein
MATLLLAALVAAIADVTLRHDVTTEGDGGGSSRPLPGAQRSKNWTCGLPSLGAVGATLALMLLRPLRQGLAVVCSSQLSK